MAFSIKQIKAKLQEYGVPADNLDSAAESICAMHKTDLDAIKEERDTYKANAETLAEAKKELDDLKAAGDGGLSALQEKYAALEKEHKAIVKEYEQYKAGIAAKETKAAKEAAVRSYYKSKGITGKALDVAMRGSTAEIDAAELDGDKIKDLKPFDDLVTGDFAGLVGTTTTTGANTATPPANTGGGHTMTKEQIMAEKDTATRQRLMAQNLDLFGIK